MNRCYSFYFGWLSIRVREQIQDFSWKFNRLLGLYSSPVLCSSSVPQECFFLHLVDYLFNDWSCFVHEILNLESLILGSLSALELVLLLLVVVVVGDVVRC